MSDGSLSHDCKAGVQGGLKAWVVCLSAGLFFLYEFFQLNLFDVINTSLREAFHLDAMQLSWLSSSYLLANIIFLLPAGILLDHLSTRRVILVALSVCVLGTFGFAWTHVFALAFLFHFLAGIGNAFCFLSCIVLISRWFPARQQAFLIGCIVTLAFLGGVLAHAPLAYAAEHYGWRAALLMDGVLGVVVLMWLMCVLQDKPDTLVIHDRDVVDSFFSRLWRVMRNPQNGLAGMYTACMNLPIMILCALWGASYLETVHQASSITASQLISLILMGSIVGCPLAGWISDTVGRRKPIMVIGAVLTLFVLILLWMSDSPTTIQLGSALFAIGLFSSTQVIGYAQVAESNALSNVGVATGIASILVMGGGGLGQLLFGFLMRMHTSTTQMMARDYQFAMGLLPCAAGLALVAVLLSRETYGQRLSDHNGDEE